MHSGHSATNVSCTLQCVYDAPYCSTNQRALGLTNSSSVCLADAGTHHKPYSITNDVSNT